MKGRRHTRLIMLIMIVFSAAVIVVYSAREKQTVSRADGIYSDTLYRRAAGITAEAAVAHEDTDNIFTDQAVINKEENTSDTAITDTQSNNDEAVDTSAKEKSVDNDKDIETVMVFDHRLGTVSEMELDEYVACVVTAEMPGDSPFEALCAQAVAARTLAVNYILADKKDGHMGADICTDSGHCQSFVKRDEYTERYGEKGSAVFDTAMNAAKATTGLILLYDDQPIVAVFHASSGGATASGKEVWGGDLAYLKSVESGEIYDETLRDKVISEAVFTREELIAKLENAVPGISEYKESPFHLWIGEKERSESGRVASVTIGGKKFSGSEVRKLLGLRSADFEIRFDEDSVTFITEGYGHGVGMSQLGAIAMARKGESFYSILAAYYPGTVIGIL